MKKRVLQIGRFVLVPQKLRPLGFFANIKNPATSWPKEINRSLFAKTEKPPGASSNSGLKRDQPYLGPLGCLAKSLRVKQRRMVSKERPSDRPTFCQFAIHILDVGLLFVMMDMISKLDAPYGQQGLFIVMVMNLTIFRVLFFTTTDPLV